MLIQLPGCTSLKEKRSRLKPLLARLHREFNISVAEVDRQDSWSQTVLMCALVSSDRVQVLRSLQVIPGWIEQQWPDLIVVEEQVQLL
jgi:hypothetical protein